MSEKIYIKKSAFEFDAILFSVLGIALAAYLNYKIRENTDAKLEEKMQKEIDEIKNKK